MRRNAIDEFARRFMGKTAMDDRPAPRRDHPVDGVFSVHTVTEAEYGAGAIAENFSVKRGLVETYGIDLTKGLLHVGGPMQPGEDFGRKGSLITQARLGRTRSGFLKLISAPRSVPSRTHAILILHAQPRNLHERVSYEGADGAPMPGRVLWHATPPLYEEEYTRAQAALGWSMAVIVAVGEVIVLRVGTDAWAVAFDGADVTSEPVGGSDAQTS